MRTFFSAAAFGLAPTFLVAQGGLEGRVVSADRVPIRGAEAYLPQLGRTAPSDSLGRFSLRELPARNIRVVARAVGFVPETTTVTIHDHEVTEREFALQRSTTALGEVRVTGEASVPKLAGFDSRRKLGSGRFIDRAMLARAAGQSTGAILASVPGLAVWHGTGTRAWAYSTRAVSRSRCAFCKETIADVLDKFDIETGARPGCYMDIYVDGAIVYQYGMTPPQLLFNVNDIPPEQIAGIEVYTGASQIPALYNRTSSAGCGVLLIWTRI